jgi:hypothetical protein
MLMGSEEVKCLCWIIGSVFVVHGTEYLSTRRIGSKLCLIWARVQAWCIVYVLRCKVKVKITDEYKASLC